MDPDIINLQSPGCAATLSIDILDIESVNTEQIDYDSLHVAITISDHGFQGHIPSVWFSLDDLRIFVTELQHLDTQAIGHAEIHSMSPNDCILSFRNIDSRGHIGVFYAIARRNLTQDNMVEWQLSGSFELELSVLHQLVGRLDDLVINWDIRRD